MHSYTERFNQLGRQFVLSLFITLTSKRVIFKHTSKCSLLQRQFPAPRWPHTNHCRAGKRPLPQIPLRPPVLLPRAPATSANILGPRAGSEVGSCPGGISREIPGAVGWWEQGGGMGWRLLELLKRIQHSLCSPGSGLTTVGTAQCHRAT